MKKINYNKVPDREKEPFSYGIWKKLDILTASPFERLLMLELHSTFALTGLLFNETGPVWETKDMRDFVSDVVKKAKKLKLVK